MVYSFPHIRAQCVLFCLLFLFFLGGWGGGEKCESHTTRLRPFGGRLIVGYSVTRAVQKKQTILINSKNYCGIRYSFIAVFHDCCLFLCVILFEVLAS